MKSVLLCSLILVGVSMAYKSAIFPEFEYDPNILSHEDEMNAGYEFFEDAKNQATELKGIFVDSFLNVGEANMFSCALCKVVTFTVRNTVFNPIVLPFIVKAGQAGCEASFSNKTMCPGLTK